MHPFLQSIAQLFAGHCEDNNIDYNIARDESNSQVYNIFQQGLDDFINKIHDFIKDQPVLFTAEKTPEGMKFSFEIKPLKEVGSVKDIPQWVLDQHGIVQAAQSDAQIKVKFADTDDVFKHIEDHPHTESVQDNYVIDDTTKPIIMLNGQVIDGFRRILAYKKAGISQIPYYNLNDVITLEDQYRSPTKRHKLTQRAFRSSINLQECLSDIRYKLKKPLLAHDNKTIIPINSEIVIYDNDLRLPDIWWEGRVINVDREALDDALGFSIDERILYRANNIDEEIDESYDWRDDEAARRGLVLKYCEACGKLKQMSKDRTTCNNCDPFNSIPKKIERNEREI